MDWVGELHDLMGALVHEMKAQGQGRERGEKGAAGTDKLQSV